MLRRLVTTAGVALAGGLSTLYTSGALEVLTAVATLVTIVAGGLWTWRRHRLETALLKEQLHDARRDDDNIA